MMGGYGTIVIMHLEFQFDLKAAHEMATELKVFAKLISTLAVSTEAVVYGLSPVVQLLQTGKETQ